jgi:hypothetical protein
MSVKEHFLEINEKFSGIIESSFGSDMEAKLSGAFQFVDDVSLWKSTLDKTTDTTILTSAINELELGFQAVVSGQYRYAFIAQRYFLEQVLRFVYLSTNELHLRHWKLGMRDISWKSLVDDEKGVFSKEFIRAFFTDVEEDGKQFSLLSSKLYRESSEFVHGNFDKITSISDQIKYQPDILRQWIEYMETSKLIVSFLLFMRFSKDFNSEDIVNFETIAQEELCGIDGFNCLFQ